MLFVDYCAEGSAAPLPCPGGTHKDPDRAVMTDRKQCVTCPSGTACSVGTAVPKDCLPGSFSNSSGQESCFLCPEGQFQDMYRQTDCKACPRGFYCKEGSSTPVPCPGGTSSNVVGLSSHKLCTPVPRGKWAPLGSAIPDTCPRTGFYCPGASYDPVHGGAKPIIQPVGGSTGETLVDVVRVGLALLLAVFHDISRILAESRKMQHHLAPDDLLVRDGRYPSS